MLALGGILVLLAAGAYYAYTAGLFARTIGAYRAWRAARAVKEPCALCDQAAQTAEAQARSLEAALTGGSAQPWADEVNTVVRGLDVPEALPLEAVVSEAQRGRAAVRTAYDSAVERLRTEISATQTARGELESALGSLNSSAALVGLVQLELRLVGSHKWGSLAAPDTAREVTGQTRYVNIRESHAPIAVVLLPYEGSSTMDGFFVRCGSVKLGKSEGGATVDVWLKSAGLGELDVAASGSYQARAQCVRAETHATDWFSQLDRNRGAASALLDGYEALHHARASYAVGDYAGAWSILGAVAGDHPIWTKEWAFVEAVRQKSGATVGPSGSGRLAQAPPAGLGAVLRGLEAPQRSSPRPPAGAEQQRGPGTEYAVESYRPSRQGTVVSVGPDGVTVDLGMRDGLRAGAVVDVLLSAQPVADPRDPSRILGFHVVPLKLIRVSLASATGSLDEGSVPPRTGDGVVVRTTR